MPYMTPMKTRPLGFYEDLGWRYDRAATLNFTTFATVRASIEADALERALRALQQRHPSLGLRIDGQGAAAVPVHWTEAERDVWVDLTAQELTDGLWSRDCAPMRCHAARHPDGATTLALTLWHPVSDGKSGIIAMRDLLGALAWPNAPVEPREPVRLESLQAPGFKKGAAGRYLARQRQHAKLGKPAVWRGQGTDGPASYAVAKVDLRPELVQDLSRHAKHHGVTLHGALSAALARSILAHAGAAPDAPHISFHPVDMRRHLGDISHRDAFGYNISFIDAALRLSPERDFWTDAQHFHEAVHGAIDNGVHLFAATAGSILTRRIQRLMGVRLSRRLFEGPFGSNAFAISNLGALEQLGVHIDDHPLGLESMHFVGAASMTTQICASAVGLGGSVRCNIGTSSRGLPPDAAATLAAAMQADLEQAARDQ